MVKFSSAPAARILDRTFAALSDPTRRALLSRLRQVDELSVSALARPFAMTLPGVMKHIDLLEEAKLVSRIKRGRVVACKLTPAPLDVAMGWMAQHRRFWGESLDRLEANLEVRPRKRAAKPGTETHG